MTRRLTLLAALLLVGAPILPSTGLAQTATPSISFTPTSTAYTAGYCLGPAGASAVQTVAGAVVRGGTGGTNLIDISVLDSSGQDAQIDFLFFSALPTGTYTDHAACSIAAADQPYFLGKLSVSGYQAYGTPGTATLTGSTLSLSNIANGSPAGNAIWVIPVVQGTPTYGSAQTIYVHFGVIADGPSQ